MPDAEARLSDFDYDLPPDRIAQEPAQPRDASRLLVLDRRTGGLDHRRFHELPDLLCQGDLLVLNDTRVIPAAFTARRATGSRIEGCFLRFLPGDVWEVMLAGRGRIREGETLALADVEGREAGAIELIGRVEPGVWHVREMSGTDPLRVLARVGRPPLPPYIRRTGPDDPRAAADREAYQTVYARHNGAVAAPTAGLHFTQRVFEGLDRRGVERVCLTLHVGLGTFQPIRSESLADHRMHEEYFEIPGPCAERISRARADGRRVIAVGTTVVRALESAASAGGVRAARETTCAFIYPPYAFQVVDGLVTNFHLPRTTLLALVCAFARRDRVLAAYEAARREGYRFYSYGDAMLIL